MNSGSLGIMPNCFLRISNCLELGLVQEFLNPLRETIHIFSRDITNLSEEGSKMRICPELANGKSEGSL